jgi:ABC-type multidrug transport system fused ATPase/permease subunit
VSTPVLGLIIVLGTVVLSVVTVRLARRLPRERLGHSQDAVGVMFSAVGVLYTVLLAFLVVLVSEQFNGAQDLTQQEAAKISNLLRDANAFPVPARREIQGRLLSYTHSVIDDEWPTMAHGRSSPVTTDKYRLVWVGYYGYHPQTSQQERFYDESITRLNDLGQDRRLRLLSSESSIPSLMWVMLILGGVITIAYLYLFTIPDAWLQSAMIGSVAGLLAFILFLILALDHPFAGRVKVTPDAYKDVVALFGKHGYSPSPKPLIR